MTPPARSPWEKTLARDPAPSAQGIHVSLTLCLFCHCPFVATNGATHRASRLRWLCVCAVVPGLSQNVTVCASLGT